MTLNIKDIPKIEHHLELRNNSRDYEHVVVYDNNGILHTVHVDKLTKAKKVICENSLGPLEPDLKIDINAVLNLYRVTCSAEKVTRNKLKTGVKASSTKETGINVCIPLMYKYIL